MSLNSLNNLLKRILYQFSQDKKILDEYCLLIRRHKKLTDSEWAKFEELSLKEEALYESTT